MFASVGRSSVVTGFTLGVKPRGTRPAQPVDDEVVLIQEAKQGIKGLWSIPAGRLEHDETLVDCVTREMAEEAGINAEPTGIIGVYVRRLNKQRSVIFCFEMQLADETTTPTAVSDDVQDAEWVQIANVSDRSLRSNYLIEALQDYRTEDSYPIDVARQFTDDETEIQESYPSN